MTEPIKINQDTVHLRAVKIRAHFKFLAVIGFFSFGGLMLWCLLSGDGTSSTASEWYFRGPAIAVLAVAACACLQIVGESHWPTQLERRKHRVTVLKILGVAVPVFLGAIVYTARQIDSSGPNGDPSGSSLAPLVLVVIFGLTLIPLAVSTLITGISPRAVFNAVSTTTVGTAINKGPLELNPKLTDANQFSLVRLGTEESDSKPQAPNQSGNTDTKEYLATLAQEHEEGKDGVAADKPQIQTENDDK